MVTRGVAFASLSPGGTLPRRVFTFLVFVLVTGLLLCLASLVARQGNETLRSKVMRVRGRGAEKYKNSKKKGGVSIENEKKNQRYMIRKIAGDGTLSR